MCDANRETNARGVGKIGYPPITCYVSKTAQDMHIFSIKGKLRSCMHSIDGVIANDLE